MKIETCDVLIIGSGGAGLFPMLQWFYLNLLESFYDLIKYMFELFVLACTGNVECVDPFFCKEERALIGTGTGVFRNDQCWNPIDNGFFFYFNKQHIALDGIQDQR